MDKETKMLFHEVLKQLEISRRILLNALDKQRQKDERKWEKSLSDKDIAYL